MKREPKPPKAHLVASFFEGNPPEWSGKCFDCEWELLINDEERVVSGVFAHERESLEAAIAAQDLEMRQLELFA